MYRFGDYELDTERFELRQAGAPVHVEPRALDLLRLLIESRDRVIDRDEIIEKLWDGRIVTDAAIATCLKSARRALGDDGKRQAWIRTVHGRGFRFVGQLEDMATPEDAPGTRQSDLPSLIVLPMQVFGGGQPLEATADALVETLTTVLTRIPLLSIVSRAASFALKGQPIDIATVRARFGAWYMLEGSLQPLGEGLRANVQLIETLGGFHLWARRIDLPDAAADPDALLAAILPQLEPQIVRAVLKDLTTDDAMPSARALTLQATGVLSVRGWNRAAFEEAEALLRRAVSQDPNLAHAHAYLALTLGVGHRVGVLSDRDDLRDEVVAAADRAIELDAMESTILAMAGCALADVGVRDRAQPILETALELNPDNAQAHAALGTTLLMAGRVDAAIQSLRQGLRVSPADPRRAIWGSALAMALLSQGQVDEAKSEAERACRADTRNHIPHVALAAATIASGDNEGAEAAISTALSLRPELPDREVRSIVGEKMLAFLGPLIEAQRKSVAAKERL